MMIGCLSALLVLCWPAACGQDQAKRSGDAGRPLLNILPQAGPGPHRHTHGIGMELTTAGAIQRVCSGYLGVWEELTIGRHPVRRKQSLLKEDESRRTTLITGTGGVGVGVEPFIGNRWSAKLELTATPHRPRVSLKLKYFPLEGVEVGFGLDSRNGVTAHGTLYFDDEDIAAARLLCYLYARAFVECVVVYAVERFPPLALLVAGDRDTR